MRMNYLSEIIRWIRKRHGRKIVSLILRHADTVQDTVKELHEGVKDISSDNYSKGEQRLRLCEQKRAGG